MKHMAKLYGTTTYLGQVGTWVARRSPGRYQGLCTEFSGPGTTPAVLSEDDRGASLPQWHSQGRK